MYLLLIQMDEPSGWDRAEELNAEIDDLRAEVDRMTNERQDMYLIMFKKGQDAAKHEMEIAADRENRRGSTPSYTGPLKTEQLDERVAQRRQGLTEEEVVLRFLRDAVYYFLLNRDSKDHLQAIMSILKFSTKQRDDVYRKRGGSHWTPFLSERDYSISWILPIFATADNGTTYSSRPWA